MEKERIEYIKEMRKRLLIILVPSVIVFMFLFYKSPQIIEWMVAYYGIEIYNFTPSESIAISMNFALVLTALLFIPALVYQVFSFSEEILPKEAKGILVRCSFGFVLALIGFFIGSTFFTKIILEGLMLYNIGNPMWSINSVLRTGIIFGSSVALSFQLIWFIPFITKIELLEKKQLKKARPFIFVGLLIISAIITPPDIFSQLILMIPLITSFETGLLFSRNKLNVEEEIK
jgi:sec-independent protein translocase protein TatC